MDKKDQISTLILIILVSTVIWLVIETKTSRDYIIENGSAIAELRGELDTVKAQAMEADYQIVYWIEEWMRQVNERFATLERNYY